jgi:hypothetical protein
LKALLQTSTSESIFVKAKVVPPAGNTTIAAKAAQATAAKNVLQQESESNT